MPFTIRPLTEQDASAMRELRLLGLQTDAYAFGASYETESKQPLSFFESRCAQTENKCFFGAFVGDQLVGLASLVQETGPKTKHNANIYAVYTHCDYRGQGISTALIESAVSLARTWPEVEFIQLGVATTNIAAQKVYEKAGFETWGTQFGAMKVDGEYVHEQWMALDIRSTKA
jgi:RimJ/RimL family protein N-acetyltransferase